MARYIVGDPVVITNTFTVDGTETDPTTVTLEVTDPSGGTDTYTYAAAEITKSSTGVYTKTVTTDEPGTWSYVWTGTGTAADVEDGTFIVTAAVPRPSLYLTLAEARGYILPDGADTDDDTRIEVAVEAASRAIDEFCRRRFYTAPETRYFTATHPRVLHVDDLVTVTTLKTDGGGDGTFETSWSSSEYNLAPYNANTDGRPYTKIERAVPGGRSFPVVRRGVEIEGSFGWPSVPLAVKQACAIQAQVFFKQATEGAAPIVTMDGATLGSSKFLDRTVELLIRPYRRVLVG